MAAWLKLIGAFLLLACFALPMTSCTTHENEAGKFVAVKPGEPIPPGVHSVTVRHYLLGAGSRVDDPWTWVELAFFIFPAAVVVHARKRPAARLTKIIWFLEPLLIAGVSLSIWLTSFLIPRHLEIGTYVALVGVCLYSLGWIVEVYSGLRSWQRLRRESA